MLRSLSDYTERVKMVLRTNKQPTLTDDDLDNLELDWAMGYSAHHVAERICGKKLAIQPATPLEVEALKQKWASDEANGWWDTFADPRFEPYYGELYAFQQAIVQKTKDQRIYTPRIHVASE